LIPNPHLATYRKPASVESSTGDAGPFRSLTNLANRIQFDILLDACLASAAAQRQRFAVLFMDLDRFKQVNDAYGHHVGDLLLKSVAIRLSTCVNAKMTLARLGGMSLFCWYLIVLMKKSPYWRKDW
jgi:diguanylate cyclase (GGDEF)-like protein